MKGVFVLMLVALVFASGCTQYDGDGGTGVITTVPLESVVIEITGDGFVPDIVTVNAGDTVSFVNKDTAKHWPASAMHPTHREYPEQGGCIGSKFDACRGLSVGEVFSFKFEHEGEWSYHDHLNPGMTGKIIVKGPA